VHSQPGEGLFRLPDVGQQARGQRGLRRRADEKARPVGAQPPGAVGGQGDQLPAQLEVGQQVLQEKRVDVGRGVPVRGAIVENRRHVLPAAGLGGRQSWDAPPTSARATAAQASRDFEPGKADMALRKMLADIPRLCKRFARAASLKIQADPVRAGWKNYSDLFRRCRQLWQCRGVAVDGGPRWPAVDRGIGPGLALVYQLHSIAERLRASEGSVEVQHGQGRRPGVVFDRVAAGGQPHHSPSCTGQGAPSTAAAPLQRTPIP